MADGTDRLGSWADKQAGKFADHPVRRIALFIALGFLLLVVVGGTLSWVSSWGGEAARITGPTNVREQYTAIIEDWQAMQAAAANACQAKASAREDGDPTILESPALAYEATYRRIAVDYNRRQANLFEGRLVGPKGYPRTAPTLAHAQAVVCGK